MGRTRSESWWENLKLSTQAIMAESGVSAAEIKAIGISYQMHGLVCVDKNQQVLRPAIIWCDSRAVPFGQQAFETIGEERCLSHLLNSPGNFTASKLAWIKQNEPAVYEQIYKIMLPGLYCHEVKPEISARLFPVFRKECSGTSKIIV